MKKNSPVAARDDRCGTPLNLRAENAFRKKRARFREGICLFDGEGHLVMKDRLMTAILKKLKIKGTFDEELFLRALAFSRGTICPLDLDRDCYYFPDGRSWKFLKENVQGHNHRNYHGYRAVEITDRQNLRYRLECDNAKLRYEILRQRKRLEYLKAVILEEEVHGLQLEVHDRLGSLLLLTQRNLDPEGFVIKKETFCELWQTTLTSLGARQQKNEEKPGWKCLKEEAKALGIALTLRGKLPEDDRAFCRMMEAIRESVINAARHASAHRVQVWTKDQGDYILAKITNDGKKVRGVIQEGGGLTGLRNNIERSGGWLKIRTDPVFTMTILLKKEGVDDDQGLDCG